MITLLGAFAVAALCTADAAPAPRGPVVPSATARAADDSLHRRLFESGVTIDEFLAAARARREQWHRNFAQAAVADAVLARLQETGGEWKLLVVAADGCSDSVNTVPYIARLAAQLPGVALRIVGSDAGRSIMEAHRTPDGRAATPTVILLDADYAERGCWIERPRELREWMLDNRGKVRDAELTDRKMSWYDADKGSQTVAEIAAMIEGAARGTPVC